MLIMMWLNVIGMYMMMTVATATVVYIQSMALITQTTFSLLHRFYDILLSKTSLPMMDLNINISAILG